MNTILKVGAAGALALGAISAHASISSPSNSSSDAILFAEVVNGSTVVASYAGDTGVTLDSIAGLSTTGKTVLAGDSNLAKLFAADAAGDSLVYAVLGGENINGNASYVTTTFGNSTTNLALKNGTNLSHWATIAQDVVTINSNLAGANSVEGASVAGAGVWDQTDPSSLEDWYKNGPGTGNAVGASETLYSVTSAGSNAAKVLYSTIGSANLTATGLTIAGLAGGTNPPPVPLPAAVWLLGSGLLGLTGVARRKLKV